MMTRKKWIWTRLGGWGLLLLSFILYEINLLFDLFDSRVINLVNGLLGGVGTFCVLVGYYMLVRDER
jgi:hypothetical protein